jgi:hypothetical protein
MKKKNVLLVVIILFLLLTNLLFLFILPFSIEFKSPILHNVFNFVLPFSIIGFSVVLILNQYKNRKNNQLIYVTIGFIGFFTGFVMAWLTTFTLNSKYEDDYIVYQSVSDKSHKIIVQTIDEGSFGSHRREVNTLELMPGVSCVEEFSEIILDGKWIKYDNWKHSADTLVYEKFEYKSEINSK